jgi:hypothetical protein
VDPAVANPEEDSSWGTISRVPVPLDHTAVPGFDELVYTPPTRQSSTQPSAHMWDEDSGCSERRCSQNSFLPDGQQQPSEWEQITCFHPCLLYWRSPVSGDLWYESGEEEMAMKSHLEGCRGHRVG